MDRNNELSHAPGLERSPEQRRRDAELMVRGIAWVSIAIGLAELLAPQRTRHAVSVGIGGWWMRLRGLRSIGGGVALLVADDKIGWLHRRSLANALDVVTLASDHDGSIGARARNATAIAAIGSLTAIDLTAARMVGHSPPAPASDRHVDQS